MRAPIGIERAKQPVRIYHFRQSPKAALGALLGDKERRLDLAVGIVHRHDQCPPLIRAPFMTGPILM